MTALQLKSHHGYQGSTSSNDTSNEVYARLAYSAELIRIKDLAEKLGISRSTIYGWLDHKSAHYNPDFPRPLKLGSHCIAWRLTEVLAYINSRERG